LSVVSCQFSVFSFQFSVFSFQFSVFSHWMAAVSLWVSGIEPSVCVLRRGLDASPQKKSAKQTYPQSENLRPTHHLKTATRHPPPKN
jgi:hypothetical protein